MKAAPFAYHAPRTVEDALGVLAAEGDDARILAGGQSLVPAMAFRMARPAVLVDINRIGGLDSLAVEEGSLGIGALVRHARFERPVVDGPLGALLAEVARHIAHAPIRQRGTFCGSLAHADPASEWCATALALDATMTVRGAAGERQIAARDWFQGPLATALQPGEMLVRASLPVLEAGWRCGFAEFARRAGDFALAMAVVLLRLDEGHIAEARIVLGGVEGVPVPADDAARMLVQGKPGASLFARAAEAAAAACDPQSDLHADAAYRRDLVRAMVRRALMQACAA
ncbi:MAG TPA: FAD binding domain-containing protein [Acetobacteraceae bacterium]|nr:FAD binding domain-containing protein [Acetobacteraceae bacterium]